MKEKYWVYYGLELLLLMACLFVGYSGVDLVALVVFGLILVCLVTAKLLVQLLKGPVFLGRIAAVGVVIVLYLFNTQIILPLLTVLLLETLTEVTRQRLAIACVVIASILVAIIFQQLNISLVLTLMGLVLTVGGIYILQQLKVARTLLSQKDAQISALQSQLANQRQTINTIEQQGRQAERNRLAARIHDQIGHGVTGSILMLEAAIIQLDKNPAEARGSIEQATENLRGSVDGIRAELREERATQDQASLSKITRELERFESEHDSIKTELAIEGSLEEVPQAVWICILAALQESLTNTLKHSNATRFKVLISLRNSLIYTEFSDNGSAGSRADSGASSSTADRAVDSTADSFAGKIETGIGLQSIEERCLLCGGKSFFSLTPHGFITKMTFKKGGRFDINNPS